MTFDIKIERPEPSLRVTLIIPFEDDRGVSLKLEVQEAKDFAYALLDAVNRANALKTYSTLDKG